MLMIAAVATGCLTEVVSRRRSLPSLSLPLCFFSGRFFSGKPVDDAQLVAGELGPGYLASPLAPYRLKVAIPKLKVVVVLRDPTDR